MSTPLVREGGHRHRPQNEHHDRMSQMLQPPGPEFKGVLRQDVAARAVYAEAAGIGRVMPQAVVVPSTAEDVPIIVRWARDVGAPVA